MQALRRGGLAAVGAASASRLSGREHGREARRRERVRQSVSQAPALLRVPGVRQVIDDQQLRSGLCLGRVSTIHHEVLLDWATSHVSRRACVVMLRLCDLQNLLMHR